MLPGVTVTITSQDRGFSRSTVTDETGRYVFPGSAVGDVHHRRHAAGIRDGAAPTTTWSKSSKTTAVSFDMKIGALTDTVQVIGETPIVDRDHRHGDHARQP